MNLVSASRLRLCLHVRWLAVEFKFQTEPQKDKRTGARYFLFSLNFLGQIAAVCGGFWLGPHMSRRGLFGDQGRPLLAGWRSGSGICAKKAGCLFDLSKERGEQNDGPKQDPNLGAERSKGGSLLGERLSFAFWAVGHQRRHVAVNRQFLKKFDCSLAATAGATSESFSSGRRLRLLLPPAGPPF